MAFSSINFNHIRSLATLAGRKFLPGSFGKGIPKYLAQPRDGYPYVVQPKDYDITSKATPMECAQALR